MPTVLPARVMPKPRSMVTEILSVIVLVLLAAVLCFLVERCRVAPGFPAASAADYPYVLAYGSP